MPEQKTKRVRIAVAINEEGSWSAFGDSMEDDCDAADQAFDDNLNEGVIYFVEADIPIPEPQTIEGTVTQ